MPRRKTALHWAAKHGNEDVIKLLAGKYKAKVNAKTNGGYTPLHLAMQYGHENLYDLLVKVYKADPNIRDYRGKKPRSYLQTVNTSVSAETFMKIKSRRKNVENPTGFLRIGSLNVRAKRTKEAFSNFLGVGGSSTLSTHPEKPHKNWGSADNLQKILPPPKFTQVKKRKSKRPQDFISSRSTPSTPNQERAIKNQNNPIEILRDSDSDTACGFDSQWQNKIEN